MRSNSFWRLNNLHLSIEDFSVTDLSLGVNTSLNKEEEIPRIIMSMFLTEFYHKFMTPFFDDNFDLPYYSKSGERYSCLLQDYWIPFIIKIKRIIRLIVLHRQNSPTLLSSITIEDHNKAFREVLPNWVCS